MEQQELMKRQLELIEVIEDAMQDYLTSVDNQDMTSQESAQCLIDVSANVLIKSVYRAIEKPENRIAYLNMVFNTVIQQMNSINTSEMLLGEVTEDGH